MRNFAKKNENIIIAATVTLIMVAVVSICFDYYYQANDDIMIKNILSGVYTGTPESRNIQMHYPMSLAISLLYRIGRGIPWYGLLLCVAHFFSFGYIAYNTNKVLNKTWLKALISAIEVGIFTAAMLYELIFTQYTVTVGILSAAGMFGIYLSGRTGEPKEFIKRNIPNIVIIFIAFITRSEMLLLMLPFICLAGFFRWTDTDKEAGEKMFDKKSLIKYFGTFAIILASIGVGQLIHTVAYSGSEWKEFVRFFDNRTELYDYQFVPSYEGNEAFYDGIGLKKEEVTLLENYNFGIDPDITADTLKQVADYAKSLKGDNSNLITRMKAAMPDYKYILRYGQENDPYGRNLRELYLVAMLMLVILLIRNDRIIGLWQPAILFIVRSGLWIYMISTGRYPARITHSLYFIELVLLMGMIINEAKREKQKRFPMAAVLAIMLFALFSVSVFAINYQKVQIEISQRDKANEEKQALNDYCKSHPDNFYFVDVYSFCSSMKDHVEYSEKIFENVDNTINNYDYLGGWIMNSPHTWDKLANYGVEKEKDEIEKGITGKDNTYVIVRLDRDTDWIGEYYSGKRNTIVSINPADTIADKFNVFKVTLN
jgi:hypothetical protein